MSTREALLAQLFKKAEEAGWGVANGASFEAFPGLEDAAADHIESLLDNMPGEVQE